MDPSRRLRMWLFIGLTAVAGGVALTTIGQGWEEMRTHPAVCVVLLGLVVATELAPVTLLHRRAEVDIATSTAFVMSVLLLCGVGPALAAQMLASVAADLAHRKPAAKVIFNVSQYSVAIGAAGALLRHLGHTAPLAGGAVTGHNLVVIAAASLAFISLNNLLVWTVLSIATGTSLGRRIASEFSVQLGSGFILGALAPLVDVVAVHSPLLLPVLLIPVGAVYLTARNSVVKATQAVRDGLTGLANRTGFRSEIETALDEPNRMRRPFAVMLIDLDRFKEINDTLGHHTGDLLLREVGARLAAFRDTATVVARLGGDEFALLIRDVTGPDEAVGIARRLIQVIEEPFAVEGDLLLQVEASVGVVVTPEHGNSVDILLQRADVAMYNAKNAHTGVELYAPEKDENSRRRLTLMGQLRGAVSNGELCLHYQPKLDVLTGRYSSVEALVRWPHPEFGMVPPDDFIPLAERSGLIKSLTRRVLEEAIAQAQRWRSSGLPVRVAVNLSARSFLDLELPSMIAGLLSQAGMHPSWLELEITESELMTDPGRGARVLERLHSMGVRLTIDDYGTGHSSLAYLSSLPVDEIKVDRCFIAALSDDDVTADDIIVRSTIEMARNLGLEVTAEGVETASQFSRLWTLGCRFLQGYYISRPVPPDELSTLLAAAQALAESPLA